MILCPTLLAVKYTEQAMLCYTSFTLTWQLGTDWHCWYLAIQIPTPFMENNRANHSMKSCITTCLARRAILTSFSITNSKDLSNDQDEYDSLEKLLSVRVPKEMRVLRAHNGYRTRRGVAHRLCPCFEA